jgi:hypothetical protein
MMGVPYISPRQYIVLRHRCNTTQLPHVLLFVRLSDNPISPRQGTHPLSTRHPFKARSRATVYFSTRQTLDAGVDFQESLSRLHSTVLDLSSRSRKLGIQHVWLHVVRLPNLRSFLDLHEPAMRLSFRPSQLPLPTDLPDPYRTTLLLSDLP